MLPFDDPDTGHDNEPDASSQEPAGEGVGADAGSSVAPELTEKEARALGAASDAEAAAAGEGEPVVAADPTAAGGAGNGEADDGETAGEWNFGAEDLLPASDDASPGLGMEDIERIERERAEVETREEAARLEIQAELDEEGRQRRQNVRVTVQYPVTLRVSGHPGSKVRTRDLSATGIGFATRLPLDLDTSGTVTIHFPDWNFTKDFVVRFVKPILAGRQIGAQFRELTEDERERVVKEVFAVQRSQLQEQRARNKGI